MLIIELIKNSIRNKHSAAISFIVALFGLVPAACYKYGSPSATYVLNGTVKSKTSRLPINNIRIFHYATATYTNSEGEFTLSFPSEGDSKIILYSFQDVDSTENGYFENLDTLISFENVVFTGGGKKWDEGTGTKTVEIFLKPKP